MALHRGIQSAIFYYLSCAPCAEAAYRKKRRKEADRDRLEREELALEQPGFYRHPSPFATNPHWNTEIELGPNYGPSGKRRRDKGTVDPWHLHADETSSTGARDSHDQSTSAISGDRTANSSATRIDSRLSVRHPQRPDEKLWGRQARTLQPGAGASLTAHALSTAAQHPPINDLHPAIVTKLADRHDASWMLQPPPSARVMLAKDAPVRRQPASARSRDISDQYSQMSRNSRVTSQHARTISNGTQLSHADLSANIANDSGTAMALYKSQSVKHTRLDPAFTADRLYASTRTSGTLATRYADWLNDSPDQPRLESTRKGSLPAAALLDVFDQDQSASPSQRALTTKHKGHDDLMSMSERHRYNYSIHDTDVDQAHRALPWSPGGKSTDMDTLDDPDVLDTLRSPVISYRWSMDI